MSTGPASGEYDPVPAAIMKPVRVQLDNNEPDQDPTQVTTRYIKYRRQNSGREQVLQGQVESSNAAYIRMRRDVVTDTIKPSWEIHHRGQIWGIIAPNPIPSFTGELEFICQAVFR